MLVETSANYFPKRPNQPVATRRQISSATIHVEAATSWIMSQNCTDNVDIALSNVTHHIVADDVDTHPGVTQERIQSASGSKPRISMDALR